MRNLNYNDTTNVVRLEFPNEWVPADVSSITLTILDRAGNELLAASALTMYTATSLEGAHSQYASEITLDSGAGNLAPGDNIAIYGAAGVEVQQVRGYDSTGKIATIEGILDNEHADNDVVRALWASITVDTSVVATFTAGLPLTLLWTPNTGEAFTEFAQIAKTTLQIEGLEVRFKALYRRAYDDFTTDNTFVIFRDEAERLVRQELLSNGLDMDRIVDTDRVAPVIMARMAYLWLLNGDANKEDERKFIGAEYNNLFSQLLRDPIWSDNDQDLTEDDGETTDHPTYFERGW